MPVDKLRFETRSPPITPIFRHWSASLTSYSSTCSNDLFQSWEQWLLHSMQSIVIYLTALSCGNVYVIWQGFAGTIMCVLCCFDKFNLQKRKSWYYKMFINLYLSHIHRSDLPNETSTFPTFFSPFGFSPAKAAEAQFAVKTWCSTRKGSKACTWWDTIWLWLT